MTIKVGDKLPAGNFKVMSADGPADLSVEDYFGGAKVLLFGVPGAFSPTCQNTHMGGYLADFDALKSKGFDKVACLAVNDVFVMDAWAKATGAAGKIDFLADGNADFVKAIGLENDMSHIGWGTRLVRFSMIVDDGVVSALNVEDGREVTVSGSAAALEQA